MRNCSFSFLEAPKEDEVDFSFPTPATYEPIRPTTAETTETPIRRFKIETPPSFTAKLKDKTVSAGKSVTFSCTVTGIPNPKITWYRDDRDVTHETRYNIRVSSDNSFSFCSQYGLIYLYFQSYRETKV